MLIKNKVQQISQEGVVQKAKATPTKKLQGEEKLDKIIKMTQAMKNYIREQQRTLRRELNEMKTEQDKLRKENYELEKDSQQVKNSLENLDKKKNEQKEWWYKKFSQTKSRVRKLKRPCTLFEAETQKSTSR